MAPPGAPVAQPFTHVVRPKVFEESPAAPGSKYTRIVFKGSDYKSPNKEIRNDLYIPQGKATDVLPQLRTGDLILVLREAAGGHKGCDHMGVLTVSAEGKVGIVHCAPPRSRSTELLSFLESHAFVTGFKILRLRPGARELADAEIQKVKNSIQVMRP